MILIAASLVMMLMMGSVYTWSVFRVEVETVYAVNATQSGLPYMVSLFFYAFAMMVAGRFIKTENTRKFALAGAVLIGLGWMLASAATTITTLTLFYGVIIGTGVGLVYGIPIFIIQRDYPEKSGLFTGIILTGFGISPLLTAPLANQLILRFSLSRTFFLFGVTFIVILVLLSAVQRVGKNNKDSETWMRSDHIPLGKAFAGIYVLFLLATTIGLMMIGLSYRIGVDNYAFARGDVALLVSLFAVCNGVARPLFGRLMDKKGFIYSARLSFILIVAGALIAIINQGDSLMLYGLSFGIFWFNLGAWLAIAPAAVKEYQGIVNYSKNYGIMFTAYGFGALLGVLLSGVILDAFGWTVLLYGFIIGIILAASFLLVWFARTISRKSHNHPV